MAACLTFILATVSVVRTPVNHDPGLARQARVEQASLSSVLQLLALVQLLPLAIGMPLNGHWQTLAQRRMDPSMVIGAVLRLGVLILIAVSNLRRNQPAAVSFALSRAGCAEVDADQGLIQCSLRPEPVD